MFGRTGLFVGTILVIGVLSVLVLLWARGTNEESATTEARPTYSGPLEELLRDVPTRDEFRVCVDGAGGYDIGSQDVNLVAEALDEAFTRMRNYPHSVTRGCDPPTGLTGERLSAATDASTQKRFIQPPHMPSPYVVEVYFVPSTVLDASFELAYPFAWLTEEFTCKGDVCSGVTAGFYVPPDIPQDHLRYAFLSMNGLEKNPLDACYGKGIVDRPDWCPELWRRAGETPSP
jgi:hypothetical protein